jgi:hypothetical protein
VNEWLPPALALHVRSAFLVAAFSNGPHVEWGLAITFVEMAAFGLKTGPPRPEGGKLKFSAPTR